MNLVNNYLKEAQFMDLGAIKDLPSDLNDRELARAIRMAISAEHEAVHLYELIVDRTVNTDAKKLIQDIADEEKVHVGELENLLSRIDPDDKDKREEGEKEANDELGVD